MGIQTTLQIDRDVLRSFDLVLCCFLCKNLDQSSLSREQVIRAVDEDTSSFIYIESYWVKLVHMRWLVVQFPFRSNELFYFRRSDNKIKRGVVFCHSTGNISTIA